MLETRVTADDQGNTLAFTYIALLFTSLKTHIFLRTIDAKKTKPKTTDVIFLQQTGAPTPGPPSRQTTE